MINGPREQVVPYLPRNHNWAPLKPLPLRVVWTMEKEIPPFSLHTAESGKRWAFASFLLIFRGKGGEKEREVIIYPLKIFIINVFHRIYFVEFYLSRRPGTRLIEIATYGTGDPLWLVFLLFFFRPWEGGLVFESFFFRFNVYQPNSLSKSMQLAENFNEFYKRKKKYILLSSYQYHTNHVANISFATPGEGPEHLIDKRDVAGYLNWIPWPPWPRDANLNGAPHNTCCNRAVDNLQSMDIHE